MGQPEKLIENSILQYLWLRKVFTFKNQSVGIFDAKKKVFRKAHSPFHIRGVSDILGIYQGRFLAIEVKSPTGYPTKEQKEFLANVKAQGGIAFVARSIEDVERELFSMKEE